MFSQSEQLFCSPWISYLLNSPLLVLSPNSHCLFFCYVRVLWVKTYFFISHISTFIGSQFLHHIYFSFSRNSSLFWHVDRGLLSFLVVLWIYNVHYLLWILRKKWGTHYSQVSWFRSLLLSWRNILENLYFHSQRIFNKQWFCITLTDGYSSYSPTPSSPFFFLVPFCLQSPA